MALTFQVVDDFYSDPWQVRNIALSLPYTEAVTSEEKAYYKGLLSSPFHPYAASGFALIARSLGRALSCNGPVGEFRLLLARQEDDDFGRTWIHSDTSAARYSGIIYLNPPDQCQGGTSFYRHRELAWEYMPDPQSHLFAQAAHETGMTFPELLARITADGFEIEDKWDRLMHIPMRFNRCIIFNSRLFHARTGSFGRSFCQGRLTQNFFFDVIGDRRAID
jgi:Family of unknown function (DUF6445)